MLTWKKYRVNMELKNTMQEGTYTCFELQECKLPTWQEYFFHKLRNLLLESSPRRQHCC